MDNNWVEYQIRRIAGATTGRAGPPRPEPASKTREERSNPVN